MAGAESRKENRAADGRSKSRNSPAEMVMPLRDVPGTIYIVERLAGRGGNGRGGEQEGKPRRRWPVEIAKQPGRDGDAAARLARHDGERLRHPDDHGIGQVEGREIAPHAPRP